MDLDVKNINMVIIDIHQRGQATQTAVSYGRARILADALHHDRSLTRFIRVQDPRHSPNRYTFLRWTLQIKLLRYFFVSWPRFAFFCFFFTILWRDIKNRITFGDELFSVLGMLCESGLWFDVLMKITHNLTF